MTSFNAEKCCYLATEHEASARRLYSSIRQFLTYNRRGVFTCVGWQVTLCDPTWQVTLRSCVMEYFH